jgi:hypothetical protein
MSCKLVVLFTRVHKPRASRKGRDLQVDNADQVVRRKNERLSALGLGSWVI